MSTSHEKKLLPENEDGMKTDTESSVTFSTEEEAKDHFLTVRKRLLDISHWKEISSIGPSSFQIVNKEGKEVDGEPAEGDFFKIDIPAPGTESGEGQDWVRIEKIEHFSEAGADITAIKVVPAPNPVTKEKDTSHFFHDKASSTFMVKREGTKITASVHGRNEAPNTGTENISDKIRNAVVAVGAMLGFSKIQWKSLVEGLIKK